METKQKFYREEPDKTRVREHGTGDVICDCKLPSQAARIAVALNSHAALVAALEAIEEYWTETKDEHGDRDTALSPDALIGGHSTDEVITIHDVVRAALALAGGAR